MSKKAELRAKRPIRVVIAVIITVFTFVIILASCNGPHKAVKKGYLVAVESGKSDKVKIHKLRNTTNVDSLVIRNYGYAIPEFNSDTIFSYSPYFIIETLNKTVYGEEKELIWKRGKMRLKRLKR